MNYIEMSTTPSNRTAGDYTLGNKKKKYHCLYMGQEGDKRVCLSPSLGGHDALCEGYEGCEDYEEGSRIITEELNSV